MFRIRDAMRAMQAAVLVSLAIGCGSLSIGGPLGPKRAQPLYNEFGAVIQDSDGKRRNYSLAELQSQAMSRAATAPNSASGATTVAPKIPTQMPAMWSHAIFGTHIGSSNIAVSTASGGPEIIVGGTISTGMNQFWRALAYNAQTHAYDTVFCSPAYPSTIARIIVADLVGDSAQEIAIGLTDGQVYLYDTATKDLILTYATAGGLAGMKASDLDGTGKDELIISTSSDLRIYASGTLSWSVAGASGSDVAIGNMDADAALEIAVSGGAIVDCATHAMQWNKGSSFGQILKSADIDSDGISELVAAEKSSGDVRAYDVDTQALKWTHSADLDISALYVGNVDGDPTIEVVIADAQWGYVYAISSTTQAEEWSIPNPLSGATDIAIFDTDNDGALEVIWGSGASSTGEDHLYVVDLQTETIEWSNIHLDGGFVGPEIGDLDGDGEPELVAASYESDSGYGSGRIVVFDHATLQPRAISDQIVSGYAWTGLHDLKLRDVDNDGNLEILIASDYVRDGAAEIYDFHADNTFSLKWTNLVRPYASGFYCIDAIDVDNDGQLEIIVGGGRESTGGLGTFLYVYNYASKTEEWHSPQLGGYSDKILHIAVANTDADAAKEILVAQNNNLYIFDGITKALQQTVTISYFEGNFTDLHVLGNKIHLSTSVGYIDTYAHNGASHVNTGHVAHVVGSIYGFAPTSSNPLNVSLGHAGMLKVFQGGVLVSQSDNYGIPFGYRRSGDVTAGSFSLVSFALPAPAMAPEPALTTGSSNSVSWSKVTGATEYCAETDTDPAFASPDASSGWTAALSHEFPNLPHNQICYFRAKCRRSNPSAESGWSPKASSLQLLPAAAPADTWRLYY